MNGEQLNHFMAHINAYPMSVYDKLFNFLHYIVHITNKFITIDVANGPALCQQIVTFAEMVEIKSGVFEILIFPHHHKQRCYISILYGLELLVVMQVAGQIDLIGESGEDHIVEGALVYNKLCSLPIQIHQPVLAGLVASQAIVASWVYLVLYRGSK